MPMWSGNEGAIGTQERFTYVAELPRNILIY